MTADFLTKLSPSSLNTPQRDQAAQVKATFDRAVEKAAAKSDLTELGKARAIAVAWNRARNDLAALRAEEATALADRQAFIERSLFGQPPSTGVDPNSHTMAVRDANARAAALDSPEAAAAAMTRASRDGDRIMVRAIADHAYSHDWSTVITETYASLHPEVKDRVSELATLCDHAAGAGTAQSAIATAMTYGLATPTGFNENQLLALAADAANMGNGSAAS